LPAIPHTFRTCDITRGAREREDDGISDRPTKKTLRYCWDAVGDVGNAISSGDPGLGLELATRLTACAGDRTCDHYIICSEKAVEVVLRLIVAKDALSSAG